ncbi:DUF3095 domain-containing protein [Ancylobacter terrae]|uniref:DUF3095 domain-containing protein n=1 Tax=Ancylobacter sp. sgz301288 TaxID=3342077 RepID=UPI00385FDC1B
MTDTADFYARVPVFNRFDSLLDPAHYVPLPDGWWIGMTDVVASSAAIAEGRYKIVNTVGASIIAAMANALGNQPFPFTFGGDGASFAIAPADESLARSVLAATAAFSRDDFDLPLRAALIPVAALRDTGRDVRIARFATSPHAEYAMFAGGGIALAEAALKRGEYAVPAAEPGNRPDLSGLSCRWEQITARRGHIVSLIVVPLRDEREGAYRALITDILALAADRAEAARPIPDEGPGLRWAREGIDIEARLVPAGRTPRPLHWLATAARWTAGALTIGLGLRIGGFDGARYRREIAENADFRKYDDGLRMTLDATPRLVARLEARLEGARREGVADYGLHRQETAQVTCFMPSVVGRDHVHFVDGADGGYAAAATRLKQNRSAPSAIAGAG